VNEYVIAKYIRLSIDDAKTDSMSIENQRLLLDRHIAGLDVDNAEIIERVDNGFSGTNFERPGVQDLLELVRLGRVNCICVKDFSRFGRNAIETGYFIERVFPLYRVRFISVSDGFDSANYEGDTGGMEVAFKFLMHEYYSIDLSKKIKSARREKMRRGEYVTKNCLFGYRLDASRRMVIDEPAADTVRLIFSLARDGKGITDIVRALYDEKRATPGAYKGHKYAGAVSYLWEKTTVLSILSDERYTGTYVAGKTKIVGVGSKQAVKVPEGEWVRIPNHHPAIVDETVFRAIRNMAGKKRESSGKREVGTAERYGRIGSPLSGKVFCGGCGHKMDISTTKNPKFRCTHTRVASDAACCGLKRGVADLENAVFGIIQKRAQAVSNGGGLSDPGPRQSALLQYDRRIESLGTEKRNLYEKLILGKISPEDYKTAKTELDNELTRLNGASAAGTAQAAAREKAAKLKELISAIETESFLTKQIADLFIERVLVFPGSRIEVIWKNKNLSNGEKERNDYAN
jgi:DNA invertase Pin-like site-specific DNA recombinase